MRGKREGRKKKPQSVADDAVNVNGPFTFDYTSRAKSPLDSVPPLVNQVCVKRERDREIDLMERGRGGKMAERRRVTA